MLHAVIMAGGSGTRFWPDSRRSRPKQFLPLAGDRTLIQQTVDRCQPWIPYDRVWIATGASHAAQTRRQLPELPSSRIVMEPCGRNTAPCIGLAAIQVLREDPDAVLLVMPADHVIRPPEKFHACVSAAVDVVQQNPKASVLFGVPPSYPAVGFGYIERGEPLPASSENIAYQVKSFREKPNRDVAQTFVDSGNYYWNSGIFVWRASNVVALLEEFQPELFGRLQKLAKSLGTPQWDTALAAEFPQMPSISIDHGILEKARNVHVLDAAFEWDDVGSWHALARLLGVDSDGNTVDGLHCGIDTKNCIIRSTRDHMIATIGLEDCIVVQTPDATLVARRDDENALRKLVALLEEKGYAKFL